MHHSFLSFVHDTLPDIIIQLYKPDNSTELKIDNIKEFTYKYYSAKMNRKDFDLLFDLYQAKAMADIQSEASWGSDGSQKILIKERIVIFLVALLISRDYTKLYIAVPILAVLLIYAFYRVNKEFSRGAKLADESARRACVTLIGDQLDQTLDKEVVQMDIPSSVPRWFFKVQLSILRITVFNGRLRWALGSMAKGSIPR